MTYCAHLLAGDLQPGCKRCDIEIQAGKDDRTNAQHIARFKRRLTDIDIDPVLLDLDKYEWPDNRPYPMHGRSIALH